MPETLITALEELERAYEAARTDPAFHDELRRWLREFVGRPTPLTFAARLTDHAGGARLFLKREDLAHTGAHKINNTIGQALLAVRMGKKRIIAETGAGQHGVASATAAALFRLRCEVYMGEEDVRRQSLNVFRMNLLGATVHPVTTGTRTLKDATSETIRDWMASVETTHYIIGSVVGPHPYPRIVADLQKVIGEEARAQILEREGRLPDLLVACVGGGSNSAGLFHPFLGDASVRKVGVEAAGDGLSTRRHAASLAKGSEGVLHGSLSYVLQDRDGQILPTHSISAGLDYPGVGPEHGFWKESGAVDYVSATDREALAAFETTARLEGIVPALEPAHAIAHALKIARRLPRDAIVLVCLSGRGDKDVSHVAEQKGHLKGRLDGRPKGRRRV